MNQPQSVTAIGDGVRWFRKVEIWRSLIRKEDRMGSLRAFYYTAQTPESGLAVIRKMVSTHNSGWWRTFISGSYSLIQSTERIYCDDILVACHDIRSAQAWIIEYYPRWGKDSPAKVNKDSIIVLAESVDTALFVARAAKIGDIIGVRSFTEHLMPVTAEESTRLLDDYTFIFTNLSDLNEGAELVKFADR